MGQVSREHLHVDARSHNGMRINEGSISQLQRNSFKADQNPRGDNKEVHCEMRRRGGNSQRKVDDNVHRTKFEGIIYLWIS